MSDTRAAVIGGGQSPATTEMRTFGWVMLALTAIALAYYAVIRPGNTFGEDEWAYLYTVLHRHSLLYFGDRPAEMIYQAAAFLLTGANPYKVQGVLIVLTVVASTLIYALIILIAPQDQRFAFVAAGLFIVYNVEDDFLFRQIYMIHRTGTLIMMLLALYLMFRALKSVRVIPLLLATACAAIAILSYEGVLPLMAPLPFAALLLWRGRGLIRKRLLMLGVWTLVVLASAAPFLASLVGLRGPTYGSGLLAEGNLIGVVARSSELQMRGAFWGMEAIRADLLYTYAVPVTVMVLIFAFCWWVVKPHLRGASSNRQPALWIAAGLVITYLGIAAFLPTILGGDFMRVHVFARVGEALTLAGMVWLIGILIPHARWVLIALIVAFGTMRAASLQARLIDAGAVWSEHAGFLRSLAHQAPQVQQGTLFVYLPPAEEYGSARFIYPFSFQYAMQYLYDDRAAGIVLNQALPLYTVNYDENGITLVPTPISRQQPHLAAPTLHYEWEAVIMVTQQDGRAVILKEMPDYLWDANYDPYARIQQGFVPDRVHDLLPPVQAID